jgi:very-short-patch-repair endonuclease
MVHEVEVRELRDPLSVRHLIARHPRQRGVANLRRVLASTEPAGVTRNDFEEAFVALLDAHGLPRPRFNAALHVRDQFFEADALWERQCLIAELDGGAVHRTRRAFQSDRRRDRILLAEGYRTTRITWHQLQNESADVVTDLRQLLDPPGPSPHPRAR